MFCYRKCQTIYLSIYLSIYLHIAIYPFHVVCCVVLVVWLCVWLVSLLIVHLRGVDEGGVGRVVHMQLYKHSVNLYSSLSIYLYLNCILHHAQCSALHMSTYIRANLYNSLYIYLSIYLSIYIYIYIYTSVSEPARGRRGARRSGSTSSVYTRNQPI